jgi:hypothetical protein
VWVLAGVAADERRAAGMPMIDGTRISSSDAMALLAELRPAAIVRGVSEDVAGNNPEALFARAAASAAIPVFAVEDFPGNFWPQPEERLDGLFVEDEVTRGLHVARGVGVDRVHPTGNPRYDALADVDRGERRKQTRDKLGLVEEDRAVLWVGQPNASDSVATLERLLPDLRRLGATLLVRAHPRDSVEAGHAYARLLAGAGLHTLNVTAFPGVTDLCCGSDLVATQFSSVAVEASHLGTPAVFALFDDLGGRYLRERKGYAVPPWCAGGAAYLIRTHGEVGPVLNRALDSAASRRRIVHNFVTRYGSRANRASMVAEMIRSAFGAR